MLSTAVLSGCAPQIYAARGWSYLAKHEPDRAIKQFQRARQHEELPGTLMGLSNAYFQKGDLVQAEAYLDEALRRYPNDWSVLSGKGKYCLTVTKDYPAAVQYLERAKQLERGSASADIDSLIQKVKTIVSLQRLVQDDPTYVSARYNLAVAYMDVDHYSEATPELQAVLKLEPEAADAHKLLGFAYYKQGLYDEAINACQEAVRLAPSDLQIMDIHKILGSSYVRKGDKAAAQHEYEQLRRINEAWAQELKKDIDAMP